LVKSKAIFSLKLSYTPSAIFCNEVLATVHDGGLEYTRETTKPERLSLNYG
jgi:hypothetical protein